MVEGADLMLEFMSQGKSEITVRLSDTEFPGADKLIFKRIAEEYGDGAFYILDSYKGVGYGLQIWLCNVTLTVFKNFPETIFILSLEEQIKKHENR